MKELSQLQHQLYGLIERIESCDTALLSFERRDVEDEDRAERLGERITQALRSMNRVLDEDREPTEGELDSFHKEARNIESLAVDVGVLSTMPR